MRVGRSIPREREGSIYGQMALAVVQVKLAPVVSNLQDLHKPVESMEDRSYKNLLREKPKNEIAAPF